MRPGSCHPTGMRRWPPPLSSLGTPIDERESPMTDTSSSAGLGRRSAASVPTSARSEPTGWVGWIIFAAALMIMIGILHAIEGFVALFKDAYYLVTKSGLAVS